MLEVKRRHEQSYEQKIKKAAYYNTAYMKPMKLYGLVKTYEYQACETENWYETNAYWFCNAVANQAASAEQRAQEAEEAAWLSNTKTKLPS